MTEKIQSLVEDALKKCKTSAFLTKETAKDLEQNGFHGEVVADLIQHAETALKHAHAYQSYINVLNAAK